MAHRVLEPLRVSDVWIDPWVKDVIELTLGVKDVVETETHTGEVRAMKGSD